MADDEGLLGLVSLATRARKVVSGELSVEKSIKGEKSHLIIISEEASDNTKKKFINMHTYCKVPIYLFGTKDELGRTMGQEFRASLPIEDAGLARSIVERMNINGSSLNESK